MRRRGFTLIELLAVMAIIGIIMAFLLSALQGASRSAERAATQALITKLDGALVDRLDALTSQRVKPTVYHQQLAAIYFNANGVSNWPGGVPIGDYALSNQRAQVIAQFDYIKAEMPDTFCLTTTGDPAVGNNMTFGSGVYPFNFAMPVASPRADNGDGFELPMGCDRALATIFVNTPPVPQTGYLVHLSRQRPASIRTLGMALAAMTASITTATASLTTVSKAPSILA